MSMKASEVLYMADYNGDLGRGWQDHICGGVGYSANAKEEFVFGVLEYFDGLKKQAKDVIVSLNEYYPEDLEKAREVAKDIRQYLERAKSVDREILAVVAGEEWDATRGEAEV